MKFRHLHLQWRGQITLLSFSHGTFARERGQYAPQYSLHFTDAAAATTGAIAAIIATVDVVLRHANSNLALSCYRTL